MSSVRPVLALGACLLALAWGLAAHANEPVPENAPETPAAGTAETAVAPSVPASPLKALVQQQLADSASKAADKNDRAALIAYYGEQNGAILWVTPEGFTARAIAAIGEIRNAADWGLTPASFDTPDPKAPLPTLDAQAAAEIRVGLAVLKYARHARGGTAGSHRLRERL